jgi:hypothetical protein
MKESSSETRAESQGEGIRSWLLRLLAIGETILAGVAACMIAFDRPAPAADASMLIGWGTPAAMFGLISGLVIAASSKTSGCMFSILNRLFELIGRLVVAAMWFLGLVWCLNVSEFLLT